MIKQITLVPRTQLEAALTKADQIAHIEYRDEAISNVNKAIIRLAAQEFDLSNAIAEGFTLFAQYSGKEGGVTLILYKADA
jgi:hypothetical protein